MADMIRVLLIEDDHIFYSLVKMMLGKSEAFNCEVLYAKNLSESMHVLENEKIDVILLDLNLPDSMDGNTVAKVHINFPDHPIIVLTNNQKDTVALKVLRQGAQEVFFKTQVNPDMLSRVIRYAIERRNLEKDLRESEAFNAGLLNLSFTPIIVINIDQSIKYINPAVEKLTGYGKEEIIGMKTPYPWWKKDKVALIEEDFEKSYTGGRKKKEEFFQKKNGDSFCVEITSEPVVVNGVCEYFLCNWVDVTERKKAEHKLLEKTEQLQERIKELDFMYGLLKELSKPGISMDQTFQIIIDKIPLAFQFQEIACGRLVVGDKEFLCPKFKKTPWVISAPIVVSGEEKGILEVYYLEEKPEIDEGPFLKDERRLIDAVSEYIVGLIASSK